MSIDMCYVPGRSLCFCFSLCVRVQYSQSTFGGIIWNLLAHQNKCAAANKLDQLRLYSFFSDLKRPRPLEKAAWPEPCWNPGKTGFRRVAFISLEPGRMQHELVCKLQTMNQLQTYKHISLSTYNVGPVVALLLSNYNSCTRPKLLISLHSPRSCSFSVLNLATHVSLGSGEGGEQSHRSPVLWSWPAMPISITGVIVTSYLEINDQLEGTTWNRSLLLALDINIWVSVRHDFNHLIKSTHLSTRCSVYTALISLKICLEAFKKTMFGISQPVVHFLRPSLLVVY